MTTSSTLCLALAASLALGCGDPTRESEASSASRDVTLELEQESATRLAGTFDAPPVHLVFDVRSSSAGITVDAADTTGHAIHFAPALEELRVSGHALSDAAAGDPRANAAVVELLRSTFPTDLVRLAESLDEAIVDDSARPLAATVMQLARVLDDPESARPTAPGRLTTASDPDAVITGDVCYTLRWASCNVAWLRCAGPQGHCDRDYTLCDQAALDYCYL